MPAIPVVSAELLGRFAITLPDGRPAGSWQRPTARRLVELLCLRPDRRITRDEVSEMLFSDLTPARAANAVARTLSMARTALRGDPEQPLRFLAADRTAIWVAESVRLVTDLDRHTAALRTALALPAGSARDAALVAALGERRPLLADEPYADWALAARRSLDELRALARVTLARDRDAGHGRSDLPSVLAAWIDVADGEPADEEAAIALIRIHGRAGRREAAMRAYVRCAAALRSQLDAAPSEALDAAHAAHIGRVRRAPDIGTGDWLRHRRLVGRTEILRGLRRRLAATRTGAGPAILLTGPAGIGKSHLLAVLAGELERAGWLVLKARSVPDDRRVPFGALRQALSTLEDAEQRAPILIPALGLSGERRPADAGPVNTAILAEVTGQLLDEEAAARPIAVLFDDAQWADASSHAILRRLVARPSARRWALVLGARSDEPGAPPPEIDSQAVRVELPPLPGRQVAAAVRASFADEGVRIDRRRVEAAAARSQGNPYFAIELARLPDPSFDAGSVPSAIVQLLRRRVSDLSAAARRLLPIVAVAGADATYDVVLGADARLREGSGDSRSVQLGLDELQSSKLVIDSGPGLALAHPLLRDAAISTISAVRRGAIHVAVADASEETAATQPDAVEVVARHRLAAYEAARVRDLAGRAAESGFVAGRRAREAHAAAVALDLLEGALRAFSDLRPVDREAMRPAAFGALLTVGNIHLDADRDEPADTAYRRALDLAATDEERARAWSALAGIPYRHGRLKAAHALYVEGIARGLADDGARARLESDAAWVAYRMGKTDEALQTLRRIAPILLQAPEAQVRCRTADRLGLMLDSAGEKSQAVEWLDRGIAAAIEHGVERELMVLAMHRGAVLTGLGRIAEAWDDLRRAAAIADAVHDHYIRSIVHWEAADLHDADGDLEAALAERDAEVGLLIPISNARHLARSHLHRAELLGRMGRRREARSAAAASLTQIERLEDQTLSEELRRRIAELGLAPNRGKSSGTNAN